MKYMPKKPMRAIQLRWKEPLGRDECPYMYRWVLNLGLFSVRLHKWIRSDDKRFYHDHPWPFITIVLRGSYTDVSPDGEDTLKAGSMRLRSSLHRHYVKVPPEGALTLLVTGPKMRNWGFWIKEKFKRPFKYFHTYGHPPCDDQ